MTDEEEYKETEEYDVSTLPNQLFCSKGQTILAQGTPSHQAFYLESGLAEVVVEEDGHTIILSEIGPGEIFGEMGVLEEEPRMASVRAVENCTIVIFSRKEIEERINNIDDKIVRSLIAILTKRLRKANQSQMHHYKNLAVFQDRMGMLMQKADAGIEQSRREEFSAEVTPLLSQLDKLLDKYKK